MTDQRSFDDRDGWIWFDGKLVPWREANVHVLTHALHYASSVFEGQRAYGGEIFKLTEHSERLRNSARSARLRDSRGRVERDRRRPAARCSHANGLEDAYMRPVAWRGSEQMGVSAQRTKIAPRHRRLGMGRLFRRGGDRKGIRLDISPWRRPAPYTAPTDSKAVGPLHDLHPVPPRRPQAKGYDDALMFDWRGQVAEATGANAFFVRDGTLHTPTPDCFLDGITRQTVIDLARRRGDRGDRAGDLAGGAGGLRAILPDRQRRRSDPGRLGRAVELRGRRADACSCARIISTSSTAGFRTAERLAGFDATQGFSPPRRAIRPPALLGRRQVVRHRFLVPAFAGSNPAAPANTPVTGAW